MNAKLSVLYIALAVSLLTESCVAAAQESTRLVLECEARLLLSGFAGPAQVGSERLEIWSDGSFRGARFGLVAEPKRDSWEGRISNSAMKLLESPPEGPPAMSPFATQYGRGFEGGPIIRPGIVTRQLVTMNVFGQSKEQLTSEMMTQARALLAEVAKAARFAGADVP